MPLALFLSFLVVGTHMLFSCYASVPGTFLLLSSSDIPLAIVPCNEVASHCMSHGGPFPFYLLQP